MEALDQYHQALISEVRRRLVKECSERTLKCLGLLSEQEIWYRPNEHSNSVGNLVLHLCGNVRQWLFSTLGGKPDIRQRQAEFDEKGPIPGKDLEQMIEDLMDEVNRLLDNLKPEDLLKTYPVQGFDESGVAILLHVTEHFSYHVGQITYFVKAHKDLSVGYYEGINLDIRSS
ncbi:MAG: DUF1572 domain-containing protein [Saprospiraceae bacterium]|nr:DUF1572 domain-containing protein [Saprospiraceae bacterium]